MFQQKKTFLPLLTLLILLCLASCGTNAPSASVKPQHSSFNSLPNGTGNDPEPGTDNKPHPTPEGHTESILVANGLTYVGSDNGRIYAFDASGGTIRWQSKESATRLFAVDGNTLYTGDTTNNVLYALNVNNGSVLWQHSMQVEFNQIKVTNGIVYIDTLNGMSPSTIYALQATISIQPLASNGTIYFSTSLTMGNLTALSANDGSVLWQKPKAEAAPGALALVNGLLINQLGQVTAWRTSDGSKVWSRNTDNSSGPPGPGSSVVIDSSTGTLYVGGGNGILQTLRVSDGAQLWTYAIPELPVQQQPIYSARVTFTSSTSYDQAIQIVGDLGLKTFAFCAFEWKPEDGKDSYANGYSLEVTASTNSAPLWLGRLQALPEIAQLQAQPEGVAYNCPNDSIDSHSLRRLLRSQAGTYLKVSFTSDTPYLKAWESLNALGFRVANPCYEMERAQGLRPTWQAMGEEASFAQAHILVLATTEFNTTIWRQQLQSIAGIKRVDTPNSSSTCN